MKTGEFEQLVVMTLRLGSRLILYAAGLADRPETGPQQARLVLLVSF